MYESVETGIRRHFSFALIRYSYTSMKIQSSLAIIGAGPSALFTLQHALDSASAFSSRFKKILVFEREQEAGAGMPYSRVHTSRLNLSNISSEELPSLPQKFADWLSALPKERLDELGIEEPVRVDEIYPRVALGDYFCDQFSTLSHALAAVGVDVVCHSASDVIDIKPGESSGYGIILGDGRSFEVNTVVIATGHTWARDKDLVYYASPWPIHKLLPKKGEYHNFPIGLLGASLSAVDVISVLAHHHGSFIENDGLLKYKPAPEASEFRLVMHSADGLLSHLQFEQVEPMRVLNRHCSEEEILQLVDSDGHLRLASYFDTICRGPLSAALRADGFDQEAEQVGDSSSTFRDFSEMMKEKHLSDDPFELMKLEFDDARRKIRNHRPTQWKEILDDLMYTLNFHAGLLPAEDHLELRKTILPFVMNVMAALPLKSAKILMAVHEAGRLELISGKAEIHHDQEDKTVTVRTDENGQSFAYRMFIDCAGQASVDEKSFPFKSLIAAKLITPAVATVAEDNTQIDAEKLATTREGRKALQLGGMAVTDNYQLITQMGVPATGLYDIAVPHAAGLRPYCYGLQACSEAASILISGLCRESI